MAPHAVFVHGSGSSGSQAWPQQSTDSRFESSVFVVRPGYGPQDLPVATDWNAETAEVSKALGAGGHLVGWSFGGVVALLAAAQHPNCVTSLTLLEPAAFSVARGDPSVEAHIAAVSAVAARRENLTAPDFFVAFMEALGIRDVELPTTDQQILAAERLRLLAPPWEAPVDTTVVARVPTLVLTGGWNAEYGATARALHQAGAEHRVLAGAGHRIQDDPRFNDLLVKFWAESEAR